MEKTGRTGIRRAACRKSGRVRRQGEDLAGRREGRKYGI